MATIYNEIPIKSFILKTFQQNFKLYNYYKRAYIVFKKVTT